MSMKSSLTAQSPSGMPRPGLEAGTWFLLAFNFRPRGAQGGVRREDTACVLRAGGERPGTRRGTPGTRRGTPAPLSPGPAASDRVAMRRVLCAA